MSERSPVAPDRPLHGGQTGDAPPPEVADFILFCYRRRHVGWPELYDEMCAVAAHREFKGWDADELGAHGLTFSLFEMQRLAHWVRAVIPAAVPARAGGAHTLASPRTSG
ncbi:MAG: hypothetical protein ACR2KI_04220 [Candidatus Limnocylindria bacterium]